jgi:hypothetical protein
MIEKCIIIFVTSLINFISGIKGLMGKEKKNWKKMVGKILPKHENKFMYKWKNLWLETDSMLVVSTFKFSKTIPWQLKNRWDNCILLLNSMNFFVIHIFRE